jgi:hypothetical protein
MFLRLIPAPLATEFSLSALSLFKQLCHKIPILMLTRLLIQLTSGVDYQSSLGFLLVLKEEILFEIRGFRQDSFQSAHSLWFIYILYVCQAGLLIV